MRDLIILLVHLVATLKLSPPSRSRSSDLSQSLPTLSRPAKFTAVWPATIVAKSMAENLSAGAR